LHNATTLSTSPDSTVVALCKHLTVLSASKCKLSGALTIRTTSPLSELDVGHNRLTLLELTASNIKRVTARHCTHLRSLRLTTPQCVCIDVNSASRLTDITLIGSAARLRHIDLTANISMTYEHIMTIRTQTTATLSVAGCRITKQQQNNIQRRSYTAHAH